VVPRDEAPHATEIEWRYYEGTLLISARDSGFETPMLQGQMDANSIAYASPFALTDLDAKSFTKGSWPSLEKQPRPSGGVSFLVGNVALSGHNGSNRITASNATVGVCFAFLSASCTTVLYSGLRRPSEKVARLTSSNGSSAVYCQTKIAKIDAKDVKDGTFELLPGLHKVNVDSDCWKPPVVLGIGAGGGLAAAVIMAASAAAHKKPPEDPTMVCFKATAGHEYTVRTLTESGVWQIELIDDQTSDNAKDFCD
jgi:hypothetical protein